MGIARGQIGLDGYTGWCKHYLATGFKTCFLQCTKILWVPLIILSPLMGNPERYAFTDNVNVKQTDPGIQCLPLGSVFVVKFNHVYFYCSSMYCLITLFKFFTSLMMKKWKKTHQLRKGRKFSQKNVSFEAYLRHMDTLAKQAALLKCSDLPCQ